MFDCYCCVFYIQGASVLRMLETVVGEENFRTAVTNYLNKYRFSNAITQNLWDEVQAVVGESLNVTEFMDTYTKQMGYPIINVEDGGSNSFVLRQKRFLKDPNATNIAQESPFRFVDLWKMWVLIMVFFLVINGMFLSVI